MALEVIEITPKHRELPLNRLGELIPDLDPNTPASLQRVFGLGLIALTMQVTNRARQQRQDALQRTNWAPWPARWWRQRAGIRRKKENRE